MTSHYFQQYNYNARLTTFTNMQRYNNNVQLTTFNNICNKA